MRLGIEIDIPDTYSAETLEQTRKYLEAVRECALVFAAKQEAYSRSNIAKFGERGVAIRSHDKQERLTNLLFGDRANDGEALRDTWIDKANYGVIGLMCHDGKC